VKTTKAKMSKSQSKVCIRLNYPSINSLMLLCHFHPCDWNIKVHRRRKITSH